MFPTIKSGKSGMLLLIESCDRFKRRTSLREQRRCGSSIVKVLGSLNAPLNEPSFKGFCLRARLN